MLSVVLFVSQSRVYLGMTTLKELIVKRPSRQFQYLHVLLDLSSHEKEKVVYPFLCFSSKLHNFIDLTATQMCGGVATLECANLQYPYISYIFFTYISI